MLTWIRDSTQERRILLQLKAANLELDRRVSDHEQDPDNKCCMERLTSAERRCARLRKDLRAEILVKARLVESILDRTGIQRLKSVELRAFDDLARELEMEQQPEKVPEITHEQLERYTMELIKAGYGRTRPIDVPYEDMIRQREEEGNGLAH